eukprot:Selendium_serpulae@DN488_c0_g1_i1.p1
MALDIHTLTASMLSKKDPFEKNLTLFSHLDPGFCSLSNQPIRLFVWSGFSFLSSTSLLLCQRGLLLCQRRLLRQRIWAFLKGAYVKGAFVEGAFDHETQ